MSQLGIRDAGKEQKSVTEPSRTLTPAKDNKDDKYWKYNDALLFGSWIPPKDTGGYFNKTQKTFRTFFIIGLGIVALVIVLALIMAANQKIA
ncbi:MAG: hypothetical protein OEZ39_02125 [Gammaproteobacteria bacterium]|nr:hypothetical protein [Gammaproteobacteria bacterium]MDH5650651.1 hypothetical protein [Gammaproteobacteria bacterium]